MKIVDVEPLINSLRERIGEAREEGHDRWWLEEEVQDLELLEEVDDHIEKVVHCEECFYYSHPDGEEPFCCLHSRDVDGWNYCSWGKEE